MQFSEMCDSLDWTPGLSSVGVSGLVEQATGSPLSPVDGEFSSEFGVVLIFLPSEDLLSLMLFFLFPGLGSSETLLCITERLGR